MRTGVRGKADALRVDHWRSKTFGPASEEPYRRRTSDWIRLSIAVIALAVTIAHQGELGVVEANLFKFFNGLPNDLHSLFSLLYRLGGLWALGMVVIAAFVAKRWRLARDLAIAGIAAWVLSRLIGALVSGASVSKSIDIVTRFGDNTPSFPVVRLAVIVAVISVASHYIGRPMRRLGQLLVVLLALAAMYLGTGLPDGILAAMFLGWGIAAAVHLAFGSPGGRPTREQVGTALAELDVYADEVALAPVQSSSETRMIATDEHGSLTVRVLGRDETDAQMWGKFWRWLLYRDGGPTVQLTRLQNVEHEAYTMLLAERAGTWVPEVVVAGQAGPDAALIATRALGGTRMSEADPKKITDRTLDALWRQVGALGAAHLAHGHLNAAHIVLTSKGPAIADFELASGPATPSRRGADIAELLWSTTTIIGSERAIAAVQRTLGGDALLAALPSIQPAALSSELRSHKRRDKKALKDELEQLRAAAAAAAGVEEPVLEELYRVNAQSLLMAVGTLIAIGALLSQIGDPSKFFGTIGNADWVWLAVALVISFLTNFATAVSLMGTVPIALPLVRTAELQLSMSFSNLAVPAVGGMAAQIRFLQKQGVDLASAVASGGLLANVGNIAAQILLFVVALALVPTTLNTDKIPDVDQLASILLLIIVATFVATALIYKVPKLRQKVLPPIKSGLSTMIEALRSPRRVFLLFGGNIVNAIMYALCLDACLVAFGGNINFWTLLMLNIFIGTIASLVPVPGGGTAVSSVGMTGALTAAGIPSEIAVAAVLANQLVASFIPAVPGWFATKNMLRDGYL